MKKQIMQLFDTETGHKYTLELGSETLPENFKVIFPNMSGTVALQKDIENLTDRLKNADITVGDSTKLNGREASYYAEADLSNVDVIPENIVAQLKGDKGDTGENGVDGDQGTNIIVGTAVPGISTSGRGGIDKYLNITTGDFYKRNLNDSWTLVGNLKGVRGERGPVGLAPEHQWVDTRLKFKDPSGNWGTEIDLKGDKGDTGAKGEMGNTPDHEWLGNSLRFQNKNGSWGNYVDIKGDKGDKGEKGDAGVGFEIETIFNSRAALESGSVSNGKFGIVGGTLSQEHPDFGRLYYRNGNTWQYVTDMSVPGAAGIQGPTGATGKIGEIPSHQWSGTSIRFQKQDGTWGNYIDLKGSKGDKGDTGANGHTPTIVGNNWVINGQVVGVARGPEGLKGDKGNTGAKGDTGGVGQDGHTPYIQNGYWYINGRNLGIEVRGATGDTGAKGDKGDTGATGNNGITPHIADGVWYIGGTNTGVRAQGDPGANGAKGDKGDKGDQGLPGVPGIDFVVDNSVMYIFTT